MSDKAWWINPYGEDWGFIVHADTRSEARTKGLPLIEEWTAIRATRLKQLDGGIITQARLIDSGFPETWEGLRISVTGYLLECGCELCKASLDRVGSAMRSGFFCQKCGTVYEPDVMACRICDPKTYEKLKGEDDENSG